MSYGWIRRYLKKRSLRNHHYRNPSPTISNDKADYIKGIIVSLPTVYMQTSEAERRYRQETNKSPWLANLLLFLTLVASVASGYFSGKSAEASRIAAEQAKRQADTADAALKESNQPLMATSGVRWTAGLAKDTDNGIRVLYANIGKSAAPFYFIGHIESTEVDIGNFDYDSIDFGENPYCDVITYFRQPTNTAFPSTNFANINSGLKIGKDLVNGLLDPKKKTTVAVRGCIFYKDGDFIHRTGFCYVVAQGTKVADPSNSPICDKGNFSY